MDEEEQKDKEALQEPAKPIAKVAVVNKTPDLLPDIMDTLAKTVDQNTHFAQIRAFDGSVVIYNIRKQKFIIGRHNDIFDVDLDLSTIFQSIDTVSDEHAVIVFDPKSVSFTLYSTSNYGIEVDGSFYRKRTVVPLSNGSTIVISGFVMYFVIPRNLVPPMLP